jgi:hypothetical protein
LPLTTTTTNVNRILCTLQLVDAEGETSGHPRAQRQVQTRLSRAQTCHVTQWQRCGHGQVGPSIHADRPRGMVEGRMHAYGGGVNTIILHMRMRVPPIAMCNRDGTANLPGLASDLADCVRQTLNTRNTRLKENRACCIVRRGPARLTCLRHGRSHADNHHHCERCCRRPRTHLHLLHVTRVVVWTALRQSPLRVPHSCLVTTTLATQRCCMGWSEHPKLFELPRTRNATHK